MRPVRPARPADPPPTTTTGTETDATTAREATKVRERLTRIQEQLRRTRASERVLAEQVDFLGDVAGDAETRRLVAETPLADREWREARTDLDRHAALLDEARREVGELLRERDRLLDRLAELETAAGRRDDP